MNYTKYWLALEKVHGIGPAHLRDIYEALSKQQLGIVDIIDLSEIELCKEFGWSNKIANAIIASKEYLMPASSDYERCLDEGISVIPFFSELYPEQIFRILGNAAPPFIYACYNINLLKKKGVALIGDKDVSDKGEVITYYAAQELARHRIVVLSGYARGADIIAHRSSLENGGETIAILPFGIFQYKINRLLEDVFDPEKIAIISPFYPTKELDIYSAMNRNKILCALSCAVYIIEAPDEGGVFEAAKSAHHLKIPLFTTEYTVYPKNASGNKKIIEELNGVPVRGRIINEVLVPNMDKIIAAVKFK